MKMKSIILIAVILLLSVLQYAVHAQSMDDLYKPEDPSFDAKYGRVVCHTNWVVFESDSRNGTITITVDDGETQGGTYSANTRLYINNGTHLFTLRADGHEESMRVMLTGYKYETNEMSYCRFRLR